MQTIDPSSKAYLKYAFVKDSAQYKIDLTTILASSLVKPVIAVIEKEEPNRNFYAGFIKLFKEWNAAISIMHNSRRAAPLQYDDGTLTLTGAACRFYLAQ